MSHLQQAAKRAQRRLWLNRWLGCLGWSLAAAAGLFVLTVAGQRLFVTVDDASGFFGLLALGLGGLAAVGSVIWFTVVRDNLAQAAAQLDVAAGLKERISSGLYCEQANDPFARAVVVDANHVSQGISVGHHLPVQVPRSANYAGGTLVAALLVFWLFPVVDLAGKQAERQKEKEQKDLVESTKAQVQLVQREQAQQMREKYPALKEALEALEPMAPADLQKPRDILNQPIKQINQVGEKLESMRNEAELAKIEEFKKLARRLASLQQGQSLAGELANSLAKGDFKSAQAAVAAIEAQLKKTPQNEAEKKQAEELKQQLAKVSTKLQEAAQNQEKNRKELADAGLDKETIEKIIKNLSDKDIEAAKKMLAEKGVPPEQISKLAQQLQKSAAAGALASKLAQNLGAAAAGAAGAGMSSAGLQGLSAAGEQLGEMESLQQQMNQLSQALADLQGMKGQFGQGCQGCNGTGMKNGRPCGQCQGMGMAPGQGRNRGPGMGPNPGQGEGNIAPERETPYNLARERTPVHTEPGRIIDTQFIQGEQFKGQVSDEFVEAAIAAQRDVQDAIAREQLPRVYHKSVAKYFDHAVNDLPADKVEAAKSKLNENGSQGAR